MIVTSPRRAYANATQDAGTQGLASAYLGGGIGELIGAAMAFAFIRRDSLHPPTD